MSKYIKEIFLENENSFTSKSLKFEQGINLIIGPKGGGKTSLLEIINHFHKNAKFSKLQLQKFKEFNNLKVKKLIYSNDEMVTSEQLEQKNEQILKKDVISQDDDLKTNIHQQDDVLNLKAEFVEKIYMQNQNVFEKYFLDYLTSIREILILYNNNNVDYATIANLKQEEHSQTKLINKFNINYNEVKLYVNDQIQNNHEQIKSIRNLITLIDSQEKLIKINQKVGLNVENIWNSNEKKILEEKIQILENQEKDLKKQLNFLKIYNQSIQEIKDEEANYESEISKSTRFKEKMYDFAISCAKLLKHNKSCFNKLYHNNLDIDLNFNEQKDNGLSFEIKCSLNIWNEINEDDSLLPMSKILESVLYKPSKSDKNYINWIITLISKNSMKKQNFTDAKNKLKESICKIIDEKVIIKYQNMDYEKLSLGQRTSLMLEQKLRNIQPTQILLLDQPEDNIDNHTIANVLVKIINEKQKKQEINQIFIVTHNANFGILLNPNTLTLANVSKNEDDDIDIWYKQYFKNSQIEEIISDFGKTQSYYLEGGNKVLTKRYQKLVGNKNDN